MRNASIGWLLSSPAWALAHLWQVGACLLLAYWMLKKGLPHGDNRVVAWCKRVYTPALNWALANTRKIVELLAAHPFVARVARAKLAWRSNVDEFRKLGKVVLAAARALLVQGAEAEAQNGIFALGTASHAYLDSRLGMQRTRNEMERADVVLVVLEAGKLEAPAGALSATGGLSARRGLLCRRN